MNETKKVKIIPFSERKDSYKSRVRNLGYIDVLQGRVEVPEDSKSGSKRWRRDNYKP